MPVVYVDNYPCPPGLCHMIYYHGDKKYACRGIGLSLPKLRSKDVSKYFMKLHLNFHHS